MEKYKILWIEDDAMMIWDIVKPLIKEGYQIEWALDEKKAKQLLEQKIKYDLIILDIILPSGKKITSEAELEQIEKFNGLRFLEYLPKDSPPVLVLSVVNNSEIIAQIESFPQVRKYIQKGTVEPDQLREEVMDILKREVKEEENLQN